MHGSRESSQNAAEQQHHHHHEGMAETPPVNMEHARLFHHFCTETLNSLRSEVDTTGFSFGDVLKEVLSAPYLMNELLALAAIHLSTLSPDQQSFYRHQAKELQTHALSILNQMAPEVNTETCVPLFLFSSILGMHEMCEAFVFRDPVFEHFLDNFIRYISLHQGVRAVSSGSWHFLNESILGPLCKQGAATVTPIGTALGKTCSWLLERIKTARIDEGHKASCEHAIFALQSILGGSHADVSGSLSITAILAWPVILDKGYVDLLKTREPHALVVLAYYGALVHSRRDMWICGDGGQFLVRLISDHLGNEWSSWLAWPIEVISG